ncbi:MAG: class I SAM-dependent methyltransferase [Verrucomicrobia bacterium]|nr:class I SAM-dependent methyltransferase [Verrucomicrobiota bacterium]
MKTPLRLLVLSLAMLGSLSSLLPAQPAGEPPPRGTRPPGKGRGPGGDSAGAFSATTLPADAAEKKILDVLADISARQRRGSMSVPEEDGRILRLLAESLNAQHVVELGTSVGYSGTWLCLALQKTGGRLTTFEIDEGRAALARENFQRAGVAHRVTLVMGDAHEKVKEVKDPIDLMFLDADKEGYVDYLNKLLPLLRPGGLVVAHNISRQQADPAYIRAITTNPALETVFLNLGTSGISVTMKKR